MKKIEMFSMSDNTSYLFFFWPHQNWTLNSVTIKVMLKKKEQINLMPTKPKPLLSIKRTYKINFWKLQVRKQVTSRLGNGHNHEILIIQKSILFLASSSIGICYNCTVCNSKLFFIWNEIKQELSSWLFEDVTGYHIKIELAA